VAQATGHVVEAIGVVLSELYLAEWSGSAEVISKLGHLLAF
jgi:hypothetical protein